MTGQCRDRSNPAALLLERKVAALNSICFVCFNALWPVMGNLRCDLSVAQSPSSLIDGITPFFFAKEFFFFAKCSLLLKKKHSFKKSAYKEDSYRPENMSKDSL